MMKQDLLDKIQLIWKHGNEKKKKKNQFFFLKQQY